MIGLSITRLGAHFSYLVLSVAMLTVGVGLEYRGYLLATSGETTVGLWMGWMGFVALLLGVTVLRRKFL